MRSTFGILTLAAALGACSAPAEIHVSDGYVRLAAVPGNPAAAYFTLHGGEQDAVLLSVSATVAIRAEMHQSMKSGAMAGMKPIRDIPLPAESTIAFAPSGKHVMLFDMNPIIKKGSVVPLVFTFTNGLRFEYKAVAIAAGDPVPE